MNKNERRLRNGLIVLVSAVLIRLLCCSTLGDIFEVFAQPEPASFLIYSETGKTPPQPVDTTTEPTEPPTEPATEATEPPTQPPTEAPESLVMPDVPARSNSLTEADAAYVTMNYSAKRKPDIEALLTQPLNWDLTGSQPTVLVFHTHGTEAFTPTGISDSYEEEGGEFRTTDEECNMLSVGAELVRLLQEAGINAVQDRTFYDYPDYLSSYDNARLGLEAQLKKYPSVKLVIDLHRDAAEYEDGTQWATEAIINGERSAQVMLVVGTDSYYTHPTWEQNLSVALKLNAVMEKTHPGSTRPLDLRKQRFNQDLNPGTVIAEIGAAGNTHREAMNAASVLAEAIILMAKGTNT